MVYFQCMLAEGWKRIAHSEGGTTEARTRSGQPDLRYEGQPQRFMKHWSLKT